MGWPFPSQERSATMSPWAVDLLQTGLSLQDRVRGIEKIHLAGRSASRSNKSQQLCDGLRILLDTPPHTAQQ